MKIIKQAEKNTIEKEYGCINLLSSEPAVFWAGLFPIICIHLWALFYIIAPYKFEMSYYLYLGVFGIVNTFVYYLVIQKFIYIHIGVEGNVYYVIGLLLMILLLISVQIMNIKMLYAGTYTKLQNGESKFNVSLIVASSSFGFYPSLYFH
ncbi:hypothetical protein [Rossellomorea sp. DA94]|uniref:hypothetical protein n=1 Tax=Rossellomorea sp. DA94 TaxID=3038653 RepID=UPI00244C1211|nr:hypothetical protein [Rossellomorea sp. DA94]WGG45641.1 hypothetical protein P8596_23545 [Rossellomorea sp. DA94]